MNLLEVKDLKTYFYTYEGTVRALEGVSFSVKERKTLGLVGETGCGKSVTALSITRLVPDPPGKIISGSALFKGKDLLKISDTIMGAIRGKDISMIFQEPKTALNPVYTVGEQIAESVLLHDESFADLSRRERKREAWAKAVEVLNQVGIAEPERIAKSYPHELSGGMCQRSMIALAMVCNPSLLIADEPTTALDVTIQAQILELMKDLIKKFGSSVLLITHNLGVVAETCDDVAVMYAGKIIEKGTVREVFKEPLHPYTRGLMEAIPTIEKKKEALKNIPGSVPNLINPPSGCRFHPRCPYAKEICSKKEPDLFNDRVACWLYGGAE